MAGPEKRMMAKVLKEANHQFIREMTGERLITVIDAASLAGTVDRTSSVAGQEEMKKLLLAIKRPAERKVVSALREEISELQLKEVSLPAEPADSTHEQEMAEWRAGRGPYPQVESRH